MTNKTTWMMAVGLLAAGVASASAQTAPKKVDVHMATADGRDAGIITLVSKGQGVALKLNLQNLDPGQHGIHIHQVAKCDAPDFKSAGGHFNPTEKHHGYSNPDGHHAGDMPSNLTVGDTGTVKTTLLDKDVTLDPNAPNSVFANGGTAIVVHKGPDDMKSDPSGNSGDREACGIISMEHASK